MAFHRSLSVRKSQIYVTFLNIPADFKSAVVWTVLILPLISGFLSLCSGL